MNANTKSEKEKYLERIDGLQALGVRGVKFYCVKTLVPDEMDEMAFAELNRMHAAEDLPDKEVLGKYSP